MADRPLFDALTLPLSRERLEAYRRDDASDLETLATYFWNIDLSESLYPLLQAFEVALRNSIHTALSAHYQDPLWFDRPNVLLDWQAQSVAAAKSMLDQHRRPHEPGRIIAELHFGFWHSMFNRPYEESLWHANQASLLRAVFPYLPRSARSRKDLWKRIDRIRRLRNRVFHYEPIWSKHDLNEQVLDIHTLLAAMSPTLDTIITQSDRFPSIYQEGPARVWAALDRETLPSRD